MLRWGLCRAAELISSECPLHKLDLSCKVADNQIKTDILPFIYSLATNDTLKELDISGNAMGDKGSLLFASLIARASCRVVR